MTPDLSEPAEHFDPLADAGTYCPAHGLWFPEREGCDGCVEDGTAADAEHGEGLARMEGRL